ncbi:MAG: VWA domain-containing protein, partial [Spirochaetales bacterium]|nr:VWA domain-containing protein [Spirochaetales bacterium]
KQAVYSALEVLDPDDTAGILAFNADFEWIVKIEPELDMESVRESLFPLSPGGGTVLLPALEEAYRVLNSTSASVKHILILSDGYADSEGFENLLNNIRSSGITVSTVAVGSDSNQKVMKNIAAWGRGRNYYTDDIRSVPSIFVSESLKASRQLFIEETFFPSVNQPHEILADIENSEIPPLHGFMLTYPKPNSEILLKGPGNNPLLSVWQYGIGRSAVFTSNLSSSWASDSYLWESSKLLFAHVLRWISRGDPDKGLKLSLSHNRSTIYIEVDARNKNGEYLNGLKLSARVILPDLSEAVVDIIQDAAGLYIGEFPVSIDGNYFVTVIGENLNTSFIAVPYPEEYRNIRPSVDLLNSIRTLTNGEELSLTNPLTSKFYSIDPVSTASNSKNWQLFVLMGLILFFMSVFLRLQNPGTIAAPFVKFAAFVINLLTGRPVISYSNFREKMENIRAEQEKPKHS